MSSQEKRVLAIDPSTRGFGFAVLEGPERLIDWGVKEARDNKRVKCLEQIEKLMEHYQPDSIVVEDAEAKGSRRCRRVRELISAILKLTSTRGIKSRSFSRRAVRKAFSQHGASTKHEIATAIADRFPDELGPRLPPLRKPWMTEDHRMSIFDATALALTFFHIKNKQKQAA